MANWQPALWSPDNEVNIYRDRIVSAFAIWPEMTGGHPGVTRILDNAVGANFRRSLKWIIVHWHYKQELRL
jgi:hypothetical protein